MSIPHAHFPFDTSPWITHFHDADAANQRAMEAADGPDVPDDVLAQFFGNAVVPKSRLDLRGRQAAFRPLKPGPGQLQPNGQPIPYGLPFKGY